MKLKYYLRGLGIGVIVTTVILMVSFGKREVKISDEEIISRAEVLGMVMPEESSETDETKNTQGSQTSEMTESKEPETESRTPGDTQADDLPQDTEVPTDTQAGNMPQDLATGAETPEDPAAGTQQGASGQDGVPPQGGAEVYRLVIEKGDVCRIVCEKLAAAGVVGDAETLRKYLFEIGYASNISVGMYDIPYGVTNEEIAAILQAGPLEIEN